MTIAALMAFVLVLIRVATVLMFLPFVGEGLNNVAVKSMAALAVAIMLFPTVAGSAAGLPLIEWQPGQYALFAAAEVLYGGLLGLTALVIFKCLRAAGEMAGQQMGMAMAIIADPVNGDETALVGSFYDTIGVLVFFSVGGHLWLMMALRESLAEWPLGKFLSVEFMKQVSIEMAARNVVMAFQLAAPILLMTFVVSLLMAIMARLVPEVNVLIIGFPLRVGVGLIGLLIFIPLTVRYAGDVSRTMIEFALGAARGG